MTFLVLLSLSFAALGTSSINDPRKMLLFPFIGLSLLPLSTQDVKNKKKRLKLTHLPTEKFPPHTL